MARKKRKAGVRRPSPRPSSASFQMSPAALRLAAFALFALFLAHAVVFGMRAVLAERKESSDAMNYIAVARNLSTGEGFVQDAPAIPNPERRFPEINLLIDSVFLSSVPLLSRGWIVPVGGSTPDRLKVGRSTSDWLKGSRGGR